MGKRSFYLCFVAGICAVLLAGCNNNRSQNNDSQSAAIHDSIDSPGYEGVYAGTLPCADCSGIYTEITLKGNEYTMKMVYQGKGDDNTFETSGNYTWNNDRSIITLGRDSLERYKVERGKLIALDMDGNIITGDLADSFVLHKK